MPKKRIYLNALCLWRAYSKHGKPFTLREASLQVLKYEPILMHIPTIYLKILTSSSDSYDGVAFLFPCQGALLQKGKGERPIGVVRVDDRILQRAMIEMLMTVKSLKVAINNPNSFGGNEDSGARKAIGVLNEKLKGEAEYYIKNRYKEFFWDNSSPKCFKCRF